MKTLAIALALALFLFGCVSSEEEFQRSLQMIDKVADTAERMGTTATITFRNRPFEVGFKETFVIDSGMIIDVVIQAKPIASSP